MRVRILQSLALGACSGALLIITAALSGCSRHQAPNLNSAEPGERILAIKIAGDAKDTRAVPIIVNRLEDEDEAVRFYAILALDKITGQRFGYDYSQTAAARAPAVEQWRRYVRSEERSESAPPTQAVSQDSPGKRTGS